VAVGLLVAWRRLAPRGTVAAAARALAAATGAGWLLDRYLTSAIYPEGTRNLSAEMATRLRSVHGAINVFEMAAGQLWRLAIDSWGVAGIGLITAAAMIARRGTRADVRIMAALAVAVTAGIACAAPAALSPGWSQTWASGRYLDGMIVTFFLVGVVVLVRASRRDILWCAAGVAVTTAVTAVVVAVYAGSSLPTSGFGYGFNFAEPAVLTQNWNQASVPLATGVALGMLGVVVLGVLAARRWGADLRGGVAWRGGAMRLGVLAGCLGFAAIMTVNLVALTQMTTQVSQANTAAEVASTNALVAGIGLKPGEHVAIASDVSWELWEPLAFAVPWTSLEFFNPTGAPPADATVVEVPWPTGGQGAQAILPRTPAGWHIVAENQAAGWIVWRR